METCSKCDKGADGFKCDCCGAESETHKDDHQCGGEHCMPKCSRCDQAQVKCVCSEESGESEDQDE